MASKDIAFVELFWEILNRKTGKLGRVEYSPQKPSFRSMPASEQPLERSTPEEQGVSSDMLADMVDELTRTRHIELHQLTIVRHGKIIYESSFDPYLPGVWHASYSMCKSFTGMAIGLLIAEGKLTLDTHILDIFKNIPLIFLQKIRFSDMTVRHLLTMSSGSDFNEVGAITGNDWTRAFFEAPVRFTPGSRFEYNSMNTFMLSAIVTELTGKSLSEYLDEKIFAPMGIRRYYWEKNPRGITKAGWGLFITSEDAAKMGLLYLNKGMWNGQQLVPEEWVAESTRPQIATDQSYNPYYGYQLWIGNTKGSFFYNGMLGQNVYCYPDMDMVLSFNAGNQEIFGNGTMTEIIRKYFNEKTVLSDTPLRADPVGMHRLATITANNEKKPMQLPGRIGGGWGRRQGAYYGSASSVTIRGTNGIDPRVFLRPFDNVCFEMQSKSVGLFPLVMQVVHNNYTHGISMMRFRFQDSTFYIDFKEGEDTLSIPVGFTRTEHTEINMNGEAYLVGSRARLGFNEDGIPVLTVSFAFIEEPNERRVKILFRSPDELLLKWTELPGETIIGDTLEMITTGSGSANPIFTGLLSQISPDLIDEIMISALQPNVRAFRTQQKLITDTQAQDNN